MSLASLVAASSCLSGVFENDHAWFGSSAEFVGDVDGDGRADLAVSEIEGWKRGSAWVLSGRTGEVLHECCSDPARALLRLAAAGDVDGDRRADLLAFWRATGERYSWTVLSGKDGAQLVELDSRQVISAGDLDGDGRAELVARDRIDPASGTDRGIVRVLDVLSGCEEWRVLGSWDEANLGRWLAPVGDVDGDGGCDLAFSEEDRRGVIDLVVFAHRGSEPLLRFSFGATPHAVGLALAPAGDVDSDGFDDVAVGTMRNNSPRRERECVRVHSGADGAVLWEATDELLAYGPDDADWDSDFGSVLESAGDLDCDGVPELLVGAQSFALGGGAFVLLAGRDGSRLLQVMEPQRTSGCVHFASGLSGGADWDADGVPDWLVSSGSVTGGAGIGRVPIYSGRTREVLVEIRPDAVR